jgi:hypothetical protein
VKLQFVEPGRPIRNAFIKSSNGRLREGRLNEHVFVSLGGARNWMEKWRIESNRKRPHSHLGHLAGRSSQQEIRGARPSRAPLNQQTRRRPARPNALRPRVQNLIVFRPPLDNEGRRQKD